MISSLDTGIKNSRNVLRYIYGEGTLNRLGEILAEKRNSNDNYVLYFIDEYFKSNKRMLSQLANKTKDEIVFISTKKEPTTEYVDSVLGVIRNKMDSLPCAIVGIGGGITMDVAKAVSNLFTNAGNAEDYQGWDLLEVPGVFKIGIPTISGTGAEATRTCVMTNTKTGLKLGMNSDYTVYDQLILDPDLSRTVPRNQYFYTGMDAYIHCIEALDGNYRNAIGDAFSNQTISLCREIFSEGDMMSDSNRAKLMVASYLGGCAIANSYVGVVHPFSAGLSVVLGLHHCIANCMALRAMDEFYAEEVSEFLNMIALQKIQIPDGICRDLSDDQYMALYKATVIHEKPLTNALGEDFREILTFDKVKEIFQKM